jgi:hypothetical protein
VYGEEERWSWPTSRSAPAAKEGKVTMEIFVAILAIVGVGLGYRYWRARTAH